MLARPRLVRALAIASLFALAPHTLQAQRKPTGEKVRLALTPRVGDTVVVRIGIRDSAVIVNALKDPVAAQAVLRRAHLEGSLRQGTVIADESWLCRFVAQDGMSTWDARVGPLTGTLEVASLGTIVLGSDGAEVTLRPIGPAVALDPALQDSVDRLAIRIRKAFGDDRSVAVTAEGQVIRQSRLGPGTDSALRARKGIAFMGALVHAAPPIDGVQIGATWKVADTLRGEHEREREVFEVASTLDSIVGDSAFVTTRFHGVHDLWSRDLPEAETLARAEGRTLRGKKEVLSVMAQRETVGGSTAVIDLRDGLPVAALTRLRTTTTLFAISLNAPMLVQFSTRTLVRLTGVADD